MLSTKNVSIFIFLYGCYFVTEGFQEKAHYKNSPLFRKEQITSLFRQGYATQSRDKLSSSIKPGTKVDPFTLWTESHGQITYPGPKLPSAVPIAIHAFTNESGFLDCMWTHDQSLVDFITTSPDDVRYIFMTFDQNAASIANWMKFRLVTALDQTKLSEKQKIKFLDQCYFVITTVSEVGNWLPSVFYDWTCSDHGCGFNQLDFYAPGSTPQFFHVSKRVDARYDWAFNHKWTPDSKTLLLSTHPCIANFTENEVNGSVVAVSDDIGDCTIAKKVLSLQRAGASGVLVYSKPGFPLQDLNCYGTDCDTQVTIPVASIPYNDKLLSLLTAGTSVIVQQKTTPSPNFYFTINSRGELVEPGWFLYPSLQFLAWQTQWLVFDKSLSNRISQLNDYVVPVFNQTVMQGKNGTGNVTVDLHNLGTYDHLYLDASLGCVSDRDEGCPPWDHVAKLYVCCENNALCNVEIGRWITSFRRGIGHWLTDVSPLLPVLRSTSSTSRCSFLMKVDAWWAQPWTVTLILRFQKSTFFSELSSVQQTAIDQTSNQLVPYHVIPLFEGGTFDKDYNKNYHPIPFQPPNSVTAVYVYAVISGHGSDENGCGEFCVTSHHFVVNNKYSHNKTFSNAGTPLGCADRVPEGVVPNEHGTWLYGRDGWCDGQQVDPWLFDITSEVNMASSNNITYFGLFNGKDPDPKANPGLIRLTSYLIYYVSP